MRHLLLAPLLVAMTGCGSDTKPQEQPTTPAEEDQPTATAEIPSGSDEPSAEPAKAGVPTVKSIGMRFVPIPAGTFTMGEGKTATPHKVTLTQEFHLGQYEVTQEQYEKVMGKNPSRFKGKQNPVEMVSWNDAVEFCRKLSDLSAEKNAGYVYRLPTEAEWEYACRSGTTTDFGFGGDPEQLKHYAVSSSTKAEPVGGKMCNRWGLFDINGNVVEWCYDWYGDYTGAKAENPTGAGEGSYRVNRGGSWRHFARDCQSGNRYWSYPRNRFDYYGFRVAQVPLPVKKRASEAESGSR